MSERNVAIQKKGNKKPDSGVEIEQFDDRETKKYIEDTTLNPITVMQEETFESGTKKITSELAKQAVNAIQMRIDGNKDYTKERVEKINNNLKAYEQMGDSTDATDDSVYPAVFNASEDWIDDLFLTFAGFADSLELESKGDALESYIPKTLEVSESDEQDKSVATIRALAKKLFKKNIKESDVFSFQKKDAIKEALVIALDNSGYKQELELFLMLGVIGGEFCFKESWKADRKSILMVHEDEDAKDGKQNLGNFKYVSVPDEKYNLEAVDTRTLIFRKDKKNGIIQFKSAMFNEILAMTLDENGKPRDNAMYDIGMLNKCKNLIKASDGAISDEDKELLAALDVDDSTNIDMDDIYRTDGDVIHYEGHDIPLWIDGRSVVCVVELLKINDTLIPIRILESRLLRNPYMFEEFFIKIGDKAGKGLPEVISKLKDILTDFQGFSVDMINYAIKGIFFGDVNKFEDPSQLENMDAGDFVQLKDLKGQSIDNVLKWYTPPVEVLNQTFNLFQMINDTVNRTTRKGPAGEKIQPNPTATEFSSIMIELQKSVNRVAIRINTMLETMTRYMYEYTLMNRQEHFEIKMQGLKTEKIKDKTVERAVIKDIKLTPNELYIEGLKIKSTSIQSGIDEQAVKKQQAMQTLDVVFNKIQTTEQVQEIDQATGQTITVQKPKVFLDSSGTEVIIDQYKIIKDALAVLGHDNVFKRKSEQDQQEQQQASQMPSGPSPAPGGSSGTPKLQKSPMMGDILKGAVST